ncbi:MAG: SRPBCC domain-containing protein [Ketobacteraceae bacterium]|nr:SRPBCC domain-containing protein [Ketobacteraceae bacterium]
MPEYSVCSDRVDIQAPAETVWQVLVDFERYPDWNPFTYRVETDLVPGHAVDLYVKLPGWGRRLQTEYVHQVVRPRLLSWGMTLGHETLLQALREQRLEVLSENSCCYQSTDAFRGVLTPLVRFLFARSIRRGFNAMAHALKLEAEKLQDQSS